MKTKKVPKKNAGSETNRKRGTAQARSKKNDESGSDVDLQKSKNWDDEDE